MSVRLFVAKLPPTVTEAELRQHFSQIGPVSSIIIPVDRETGRKRGFAFVDMENAAAAHEAISRLNNAAFKGQNLAVSEARPREERRPGAPGGRPDRPPGTHSRPPGAFGRPDTRRGSGPMGDTEGERPARRARGGPPGKKPTNRRMGEAAPRGPIRERRTGRLLDLGDDDADAVEPDFDNIATSAPHDSESAPSPTEPEKSDGE